MTIFLLSILRANDNFSIYLSKILWAGKFLCCCNKTEKLQLGNPPWNTKNENGSRHMPVASPPDPYCSENFGWVLLVVWQTYQSAGPDQSRRALHLREHTADSSCLRKWSSGLSEGWSLRTHAEENDLFFSHCGVTSSRMNSPVINVRKSILSERSIGVTGQRGC